MLFIGLLANAGLVNIGWVAQDTVGKTVVMLITGCVNLFLCPPPSRYSRHPELRSRVERVAARLPELDRLSPEMSKEVAACVSQVRERTEARLTVLWWLPATFWAFFWFVVQRFLDKQDQALIPWGTGLLALAILSAVFLSANRRGGAMVIAVAQGVLYQKAQQQAPERPTWSPRLPPRRPTVRLRR